MIDFGRKIVVNETKNMSTQDQMDELAKALPQLTPEQAAEVSPKFRRQKFLPREVIIRQGEIADRFYIVISGYVEIWHESLTGSSEMVDKRGQGEYFGETGILQNRPRTATVRAPADTEVEVLVLDSNDFQEMMEDSRATEMHVAREMIQRLIRLANAQ